jgi:short-subunit dehydrogenase
MKYVLITGVSTGIGYDTTKVFLKNGYSVFGSVRKKTDAERLQLEFGDHFTRFFYGIMFCHIKQ